MAENFVFRIFRYGDIFGNVVFKKSSENLNFNGDFTVNALENERFVYIYRLVTLDE